MIKRGMLVKLVIFGILTSLYFVFVGKANIAEGNELEKEKQEFLNEFVASDEWAQTKNQIKEDTSTALKEGKIDISEYNKLQKELNNREVIEDYIQDERLNELNQEIEENKKDQKTCMVGGLAGLGMSGLGFIGVRAFDDEFGRDI